MLQSLVAPVMVLTASMWIVSNCFLASVEELSQTESLYSRRGLINDMYIFSSDFLLTLNLSARIRFSRLHTCPHIFSTWSDQVYLRESVRPKCLCVWVSEITIVVIVNGGCIADSVFLDIIIENALPAWKLTSHASAQLAIMFKSVLRIAADNKEESTTIYMLVSSANRRIEAPMFRTMSFIYIYKKKQRPKNRALWDTCFNRCLPTNNNTLFATD